MKVDLEKIGRGIGDFYRENERPIRDLVGTVAFAILGFKFGVAPAKQSVWTINTNTRSNATSKRQTYLYKGSEPILDAATGLYNVAVGMDDSWYRYQQAKKIADLAKRSAPLTDSVKSGIIFYLDKLGQIEEDIWYRSKIGDLVVLVSGLRSKEVVEDEN